VVNLCTDANSTSYIITTGQFYQSYLGLIDGIHEIWLGKQMTIFVNVLSDDAWEFLP
jgi:hypothetical protein